jgi:hypothetical protein
MSTTSQQDIRQIITRAAQLGIAALSGTPIPAGTSGDVVLAAINTIFADATDLATPATLALRSINGNAGFNNVIYNMTTTATAAATTTLTVASTFLQQFTGTTTQIVQLPAANTLKLGHGFWITNRSTGSVTVNDGSGGFLQTMASNSQSWFFVTSISSVAGSWDIGYSIANPLSNPMTTLGDMISGGLSGNPARVPGNTTSTINFLAQTGTGSASAAPVWTSFLAPTVTRHTNPVRTSGVTFVSSTFTTATSGTVYYAQQVFSSTSASPAVLTVSSAHNLQLNDTIQVFSTTSLPTGMSQLTTYYVGTIPSATTFTISLQPNNIQPINTTSTGTGTLNYICTSRSYTLTQTLSSQSTVPTTETVVASPENGVVLGNAPASGFLTTSNTSSDDAGSTQYSSAFTYSNVAGALFTITPTTVPIADGTLYQDIRPVTFTASGVAVVTTSVAHNLIPGNTIIIVQGTPPGGLSLDTIYYVVGATATTFNISATYGGSPLSTTSAGSGVSITTNDFTVATGGGMTGQTLLFTTASNPMSLPGVSGALSLLSGSGPSNLTFSSFQNLYTYTVPTSTRVPLYLEVEMVGGGGGGGSANSASVAATAGTNTAFGTQFVLCGGGQPGAFGNSVSGGIGGIVLWNASPFTASQNITQLIIQNGVPGQQASFNASNDAVYGGNGGISPFTGAGYSGINAGNNASPNSGSGGAGAGNTGTTNSTGSGGGSGAYAKFIVPITLATSFLYTIGSGGAGEIGSANGGSGGSGILIIKEHYQ